jgi:hypothetical protein
VETRNLMRAIAGGRFPRGWLAVQTRKTDAKAKRGYASEERLRDGRMDAGIPIESRFAKSLKKGECRTNGSTTVLSENL